MILHFSYIQIINSYNKLVKSISIFLLSFTMDLNYPEECYSKSSSEENDHDHHDMGTGRSYECIFCKRGFTTAQALGGHMNIHRKEKANKTKPGFAPSPSSSSNKVDVNNNYADLRFYSQIPSHFTAPGVDANNSYREVYFPVAAPGIRPYPGEVLCVENQDWRTRNLSLYSTNPLCFREIKDKFEDNEESGLDLELRLGHHR